MLVSSDCLPILASSFRSFFLLSFCSYLRSIRIPGICTGTRHRGDRVGRRFFFSFLPWFFSRGFISLFFLCTIWAWLLVGILGFNRLDTILYRCFGFCGWGLGSFSIVKYFKFATTRYFNFAITKCKNWLLYFAKVVFGGVRSSCLDSGLGNLAPL